MRMESRDAAVGKFESARMSVSSCLLRGVDLPAVMCSRRRNAASQNRPPSTALNLSTEIEVLLGLFVGGKQLVNELCWEGLL